MLDFAAKLTERPAEITEADRQALRDQGFSDAGIWDVVATTEALTRFADAAVGAALQPAALEPHRRHRVVQRQWRWRWE